jgi:hypothetical protein
VIWIVLLERAFIPPTLLEGLLVRGSCSVLTVDPFASLEPFLIIAYFHSSFFFAVWFRARTRVRWVALVMSVNFCMID